MVQQEIDQEALERRKHALIEEFAKREEMKELMKF